MRAYYYINTCTSYTCCVPLLLSRGRRAVFVVMAYRAQWYNNLCVFIIRVLVFSKRPAVNKYKRAQRVSILVLVFFFSLVTGSKVFQNNSNSRGAAAVEGKVLLNFWIVLLCLRVYTVKQVNIICLGSATQAIGTQLWRYDNAQNKFSTIWFCRRDGILYIYT